MQNKNAKFNKKHNKSIIANKTKNIILFAFVILSIVTIVVLSSIKTTQAKEELSLNKYYKTIMICADDTLWDIASIYKEGSGKDLNAYIKEIKQINNISSDELSYGMKLIVPYYAE